MWRGVSGAATKSTSSTWDSGVMDTCNLCSSSLSCKGKLASKEEGKGLEDAFPTLLVNLAQWEKLFSKEARKKVIVGRQKGLKTHAPKLVSHEQREETVFSSITASRWVWDLANGERGWASGSSHVPFSREQRMDIPRSSQLKEFQSSKGKEWPHEDRTWLALNHVVSLEGWLKMEGRKNAVYKQN